MTDPHKVKSQSVGAPAASKAPPTDEIRINPRIVRCVDVTALAPMQVGVDGNWIDVKQSWLSIT